jgi:hypothetical protein
MMKEAIMDYHREDPIIFKPRKSAKAETFKI